MANYKQWIIGDLLRCITGTIMSDTMLNELNFLQNLMNTMLRNAETQFEEVQRSMQSMPTLPILPLQGLGINIIDNDNEIIATAKVPPNSNVNLTPNRLEISYQNTSTNMQSSFFQSIFYQSISLPNIDPSSARTSYNNGILEIRIPKRLMNTRKRLALLPGIVDKNIMR